MHDEQAAAQRARGGGSGSTRPSPPARYSSVVASAESFWDRAVAWLEQVPAFRLTLHLLVWLIFPHGESPPTRAPTGLDDASSPPTYATTAAAASSAPEDEAERDRSAGGRGRERTTEAAALRRRDRQLMRLKAEDVLEGETRFKFALLSTTMLLLSLYNLMLFLFLCPSVQFRSAVVSFTPRDSDTTLPPEESDSAPTFKLVIAALVVINCSTFVMHHVVRSMALSIACVFVCVNGSVWLICVMWGPVSELLGALVHVPVLAFYVLGHRAGVATLLVTLVQAFVYTAACVVGVVPTSGNTLTLGLVAQMTAVGFSYVLLGLCAALNERSRTQAVRMYQEAHRRLSRATKAKARFLANVSHELRTPLHGIVAASEELLDRTDRAPASASASQPAVRDMCDIVVESSHHMLALINDVLDFEQIDNNQLKLEHIPFDLKQEISKLIKMLEPTARAKRISLTYRTNLAAHCRLGDPLRFRQILFNLIANALKFTPENGKVHIIITEGDSVQAGVPPPKRALKASADGDRPQSLQRASSSSDIGEEYDSEDESDEESDDSQDDDSRNGADLVTVVVKDSGIGIPEDHIPLLFKSFTQAELSTTRRFGGSGLGLAICKRLCRLMHGRIGCVSEKDKGSTFWFTLPLPTSTDEAMAARTLADGGGVATESLRGLRTLLVEDNKVNQLIGRQMLMRAGCDDVVVAYNGAQALEMWSESSFDVILMDYHMPVMDGLEATKRIRERESDLGVSRTPIIALSASLEPSERELGASAGMDDWLGKPFDRRVLARTILRWARQRPSSPPS